MGIASFFKSLFEALIGLFTWLQQGQLLRAGKKEAQADQLEEQAHEIKTAVEVRESVRTSNAAVPVTDSLPDDGFRRD